MDLIFKISSIGGLVLILVTMGTILIKVGKHNQKVEDHLGNIDKTLDVFKFHINNNTIHVNEKLEEHIKAEAKEWRRGVDTKLDLLLLGTKVDK
jgi:hypothetical protein